MIDSADKKSNYSAKLFYVLSCFSNKNKTINLLQDNGKYITVTFTLVFIPQVRIPALCFGVAYQLSRF